MLYEELTSTIIHAAHEVHNILGFGFLEAVYGKAVVELRKEHEWQLINYLAASDKKLGLLINFGHSVQVRRKINTNGDYIDED